MRALLVAALLVGCAGRAHDGDVAPPPSSLGWRARAAIEEERALGAAIDDRLSIQLGFYGDRRLSAYVERVGRRVARGAERSDVDFTFRVVDDPAVTAFAAPGGFVYVTRGLLAHLDTESELAAVLAHEVAHVDRRHRLREMAWQDQREVAWTSADGVRFYERSRDNEREADRVALGLLERAGVDPRALSVVLARLDRLERARGRHDEEDEGWLSSHPATAARIARIAHVLGADRARPAKRDRRSHWAAIDGMAFGENPQHGFVRGRTWVLPRARLGFDLPAGWNAQSSANMLCATRPDGKAALIVIRSVAEPTQQGELEGRHITIAGRRAFSASVDVDAEQAARVAIIDLGREHLFVIATAPATPRDVGELERVLDGFHVLDQTRALERGPPRLLITRTERPTDLAALAGRSRSTVEELALLNGISAGAVLPRGARLKLVAR